MNAPKKITPEQLINFLLSIETIRQKVINIENKQKPFAEIKGISIRTLICVN